jgi:hypothetical protein
MLTVVESEEKSARLSDGFVQELRETITRGDAVYPLPETAKLEPGDEMIVHDGSLRGVCGSDVSCEERAI